MKKITWFLLALAAFSLSFCKSESKGDLLGRIKKRGYLSVAMEPGYMPFEMKTKNGELIGFDVEMAREFAKKLGVDVKFQETAWDGIIPALMTKDGDDSPVDLIISGMTITEERSQKVNFTQPYFNTGQTFFVGKANPKNIKSWQDLNQEGVIIATKLGVTGEFACKKLFPKATLKLFKTEADAAVEVQQGKAHAMVYDQPYVAAYVKKNPEAVTAFLEPFTDEPLGMAIRKQDGDLLKEADAFVAEFKQTQLYKDLYQKYFVDMPWFGNIEE